MVRFAFTQKGLQFGGAHAIQRSIIAPRHGLQNRIVRHQTERQNSHTAMTRDNDLWYSRHSDHISAQIVQQAALSSCLITRPRHERIHTLVKSSCATCRSDCLPCPMGYLA